MTTFNDAGKEAPLFKSVKNEEMLVTSISVPSKIKIHHLNHVTPGKMPLKYVHNAGCPHFLFFPQCHYPVEDKLHHRSHIENFARKRFQYGNWDKKNKMNHFIWQRVIQKIENLSHYLSADIFCIAADRF